MVDSQKWDPDNYARTASFVPRLGAHLIERLHPRPGELILDVGCGDGTLTADIAASGARVIGIDSSPEMVEAARRRGLDVRLMAAERLDLKERFDAAFSNAALHWVRDLEGAVAGIARHLEPGGRFIGEFGGHGNVAAILTAILARLATRGIDGRALNPWHYPTADAFAGLLRRTDSRSMKPCSCRGRRRSTPAWSRGLARSVVRSCRHCLPRIAAGLLRRWLTCWRRRCEILKDTGRRTTCACASAPESCASDEVIPNSAVPTNSAFRIPHSELSVSVPSCRRHRLPAMQPEEECEVRDGDRESHQPPSERGS